MRLRLNLQWKVLLVVAGTMTFILLVSAYLHALLTRSLIEEFHYDNAVGQVVTIAKRTATHDYFTTSLGDLLQDIQFVVNSRVDFSQIDVYQTMPDGVRLVASTAPDAQRLPVLDENTQDNELGEMERPLPEVVSVEIEREGNRLWVITAAINDRDGSGYVTALVHKSSRNDLVSRLQAQHNMVLAGAAVASIALLYILFALFFRRPARDIVNAMSRARVGDLTAHVPVRRDDELGTIARGFNRMIDDIRARAQEREQLLAQVNNFNEELRREVSLATRELRASNEALFETQQRLARSERMATVGQIAASLAHEIGTPLNAISGHLHLLGRNHPQDKDTQRRVGIINSQLDFIVRTVKSLLARTHRQRPALQPLDLNALVQELLTLVGPALEAHAVTTAASLDKELPLIEGDRDSLLQLFLNLVNNGVEAMPDGGRFEVTTRLDRRARYAEVVFRDSGGGVEPSALDHLFEPMWTTKEKGSGFGLAIAREIAVAHGGQVEFVGGQLQGAAFRLVLPLSVDFAHAPHEVMTDVA
jgi:two-component system NtrC family sensor kinase